MVFSSPVFLFLFLPLVLVVYYNPFFKGRAFRNHTLLTGSQVVGVGRVEEADAFATIDQWRMTGSK